MTSLLTKLFTSSAVNKNHFIHLYRNFYSTSRRLSQISSLLPDIQVFNHVAHLRQFRQAISPGNSLGLVPTMGALHDGHIALAKQAAAENSNVIISIYVNPTQFGVNEDLSTYPRTWDDDMARLDALNKELSSSSNRGRITAIFAPSTAEMYPTLPPSSAIDGAGSFVTITPLGAKLEGASRPVFFRGVATVCMKLFNAVQPNRVYFGQKDFQQTAIIRRLITDFHLPIEFRMGPTIREADGLAMSSRNVYLGERRRNVAVALRLALLEAERAYVHGKTTRQAILELAVSVLLELDKKQMALPEHNRALYKIDYISLADIDDLNELDVVDPNKGAVISGAILMQPLERERSGEKLGSGGDKGIVRLIDNIVLKAIR